MSAWRWPYLSVMLLTTACSKEAEPVCEGPVVDVLPCEDAMVLDLGFQDVSSDGAVDTTTDGEDFVTHIDASAGGYGNSQSNPWVYVQFTETGAVKLDLSDEEALGSTDWHLSAKRFNLRLNGGSSGTSCVGAMALLDRAYADVVEVPEGATYATDDYYTPDCTMINDSSGLPDNPQTALSAWWSYPGCVATSEIPFLVQLADGRVVKLVVEQYYGSGQAGCNADGSPGQDSGQLTLRWRFL